VVDSVDDWNRHDGVVSVDRRQQWRQPILVHFAMGVEVDDDFTGCFLSSSKIVL
jgi:hypothetical protein